MIRCGSDAVQPETGRPHASAAGSGDVASAVESTWTTASTQIKTVVDNVVFPVIDMVLAIAFFVKLGTAYFDCAPVMAFQ